MFCPQCGNEIPDQSTFCPKCGANVKPKAEAPAQPGQVPAPGQAAPQAGPQVAAPLGGAPTAAPQDAMPASVPLTVNKKSNKLPIIIIAVVAVAIIVALCLGLSKCGGGKVVDENGNVTPAIVNKNTTMDKIQKIAEENGYKVYDQTTEGGYTSVWYEESDELEDDFKIFSQGDDIVGAVFYADVITSAGFEDYIDKYCNCKHASYYDSTGDSQADLVIADCTIDGRDGIMVAELDSDGLATITLLDSNWIDEYFEQELGMGLGEALAAYGISDTGNLREALEQVAVHDGATAL